MSIKHYKSYQNGKIDSDTEADAHSPIRTFICLGVGYEKENEEFRPKSLYMIPVEKFYGEPVTSPYDTKKSGRFINEYWLDELYKIDPDKIEYRPATFVYKDDKK